ncbi:MAG: metallophosphoesterase [Treponema sp.]|nr:metallophosphoesterase [Treponema sp.]
MKSLLKLVKIFCLMYVTVFCLLSCSNYGFFWGRFDEADVDERSPSLRNLNAEKPDFAQTVALSSKYSVLLITDIHYGSESEEFDEKLFLDWLDGYYSENLTSAPEKLPRFAVNLGDIADGGHDSEYNDYIKFEKKIKAIAGKYLYGENDATADADRKFKVYSILGNHDLYNNGEEYFLDNIYPYYSSYYFSIKASSSGKTFSYYFLDTANGTCGSSQLDDFEDKIKADPNPKVILTHYPVWAGGTNMFMILQNTQERNTLLTYFAENNVKHVYEGHAHDNYGYDFKLFREDVIGSLRFSNRAKKQCAVFTVDEENETVTTNLITF